MEVTNDLEKTVSVEWDVYVKEAKAWLEWAHDTMGENIDNFFWEIFL